MACTQADTDANKNSFNIWVSDGVGGGTCYTNIHPDEKNVYLVMADTAEGEALINAISGGELSLTNAEFAAASASLVELGVQGDDYLLTTLMDKIDIYRTQGGLDRTNAPTSSPSGAPSFSPSVSLAPSKSNSPSISTNPSISLQPSEQPSISENPSMSSEPSRYSSTEPSLQPSDNTDVPSSQPSTIPSISAIPSSQPSSIPSLQPSLSTEPTTDSTGTPSATPSVSGVPSLGPSVSSQPSLAPSQISQVARTTTDNVFNNIANDPEIAHIILETQLTMKKGGVLVCGSAGEIESGK